MVLYPDYAFPLPQKVDYQPGMGLREYFAAAALTGLITTMEVGVKESDDAEEDAIFCVAALSYKVADAMIEARRRARNT